MRRRATSHKRTEGEELELNMEEKEATPVEDIETVLPLADPNVTTEGVDIKSLIELIKQMNKNNEKNHEE